MKNTILIFMILFLLSCNGSKSLTKKGTELEFAGNFDQAADNYYNALLKNRQNIEAQIGLSSAGQKVFDRNIQEFNNAFQLSHFKDAVYEYDDVLAFNKKLNNVGMKFEPSEKNKSDYFKAKDNYISELYTSGNNWLAGKKYKEANLDFSEILKFDPSYKDAKQLENTSFCEPLYIESKNLMGQKKYKAAYAMLTSVSAKDASYKDVFTVKSKCLADGTTTVALMPFENYTWAGGEAEKIEALTLKEMNEIRDPFFKIIDRESILNFLHNHHNWQTDHFNAQTASQIGKEMGAKMMIIGKLMTYKQDKGQLLQTKRNGFESYQIERTNPTTHEKYYETAYKPVFYYDNYIQNRVIITFQYKMVSLITGEIVFSDISDKFFADEVLYGTYQGNVANLFFSDGSKPLTSQQDKDRLNNLFNARRAPREIYNLSTDAEIFIACEIEKKLAYYLEKLP
jgi:tetratricopeptide (TPR) repeat protein